MSLTLKRHCIRYRRVAQKSRSVKHARKGADGEVQRTIILDLKGLQFPLECFGELITTVPTLASEGRRTPVFDTCFPEYEPHVAVQRTFVHLEDSFGPLRSFALYYRYHRLLERNEGLKIYNKNVIWKGDMLVMLLGKRDEYVGMKNWYDHHLALKAVERFLQDVATLIEAAQASNTDGVEFPREVEYTL